jgi:hypothetical protein
MLGDVEFLGPSWRGFPGRQGVRLDLRHRRIDTLGLRGTGAGAGPAADRPPNPLKCGRVDINQTPTVFGSGCPPIRCENSTARSVSFTGSLCRAAAAKYRGHRARPLTIVPPPG